MTFVTEVGNIGNIHGGLVVKLDKGQYFWAIRTNSLQDNRLDWERIPESLYNELIKFNSGQDDLS